MTLYPDSMYRHMIHDVHTHRLPPNPEEAIVCCRYSDFPLAIQQEATYLSVGIHPWYLTQEDIQLQLEWLNNRLQDQRIIAIGESGLDKCCRTPLDLQLEAFEKQTARSESLHLACRTRLSGNHCLPEEPPGLPTLDYPRIPRKERSCQKPPRPRLLPLLRTEIPTGNPPLRTRRPSPAGDRRIFATYP